ncbi:MAG: cytochrome c biogenesis protein CcdA [Dehalococcoidia bacterium]|nr:cytochrome c biogenesis protein CcdA [Dehalococcoidia bacterium]
MLDPISLFQTWLVNWAAALVALLPISWAFGAGMVSTVNPCGFAMLPAYLSLYLGTGEETLAQRSAPLRTIKAVYIGGVVTLGFVVLFGAVGLGLAIGGQFLVTVMPWAGLGTGIVLAIVGMFLLSGKHTYSAFFMRLAGQVSTPGATGIRAFFLVGIGYGIASLACTLPVFLVVVVSAIAVGGVLGGLSQFLSYAMGMGLVLVILTMGIALFKGAAVGPLRAMVPHVQRVSAALILLMGSYLVYYWLTKGGVLDSFA